MLLVTKKFKIVLKTFLHTYSFYTMEEYFSQPLINTLRMGDANLRFCITNVKDE
jgi:hypothetical protein